MERSLIAHCGEVDILTGEFLDSDIFDSDDNIYGFWGNDTCYEVYKTASGKVRVVATSGTEPINSIGNKGSFISNDIDEPITFTGKMIEYVVGDDGFRSLGSRYGSLIDVSTYK